MKQAYMIMVHHNMEQLLTLVKLLDYSDSDIYIHADNKFVSFNSNEILDAVQHARVYFIPRMSVSWGGDSLIFCELSLLKAALGDHHDYYHLLSGDDLPVKSHSYITEYLKKHNGTEFVGISFKGKPADASSVLIDRLRYWYPLQNYLGRKRLPLAKALVMLQRLFRIDRLRNQDITIAKGPTWFSITEPFAKYVLKQSAEIRKMFSSSLCGDELFLQTLLVNSPFSNNVIYCLDDNAMAMRYIRWEKETSSPEFISLDDAKDALQSQCLFARKFDLTFDADAVELICRELFDK